MARRRLLFVGALSLVPVQCGFWIFGARISLANASH
jgi:hypothetical protein